MGQTNEKNSQNCSISQKNIALPTAKGKKEATRAEFLWELLYLLRKFADFIIKISALQKNMIKLKNYFEIGKRLLQKNSAEVLSQDYSLRQLGAKSSLSSFLPVLVRVHIYKSTIYKTISLFKISPLVQKKIHCVLKKYRKTLNYEYFSFGCSNKPTSNTSLIVLTEIEKLLVLKFRYCKKKQNLEKNPTFLEVTQ